MFETSPSTEKLDTQLAKAQGEIEAASKDKVNPAFRSKYADLTSVWSAIRPALTKHGISVTQWPIHSEDDRLHIITRVAHAGEWLKAHFSIPVVKKDAHGYGSAVTYAKRFSLAAAVGVVADDDDDGNAATGKPGVHRPTDGAMDGLDAASATRAKTLANGILDAWTAEDMGAAAEIWEGCKDSDIKIAAWGELGQFSKQRNQFKAYLVQRDKDRGVKTQ